MIGIYKIINLIDGKYYVGSSNNIKARWRKHKNLLKWGIHSNIKLQRAYDKYGAVNFIYSVIEECPQIILQPTEQRYLDACQLNPKLSYNICLFAESAFRGRKLSPSHKLALLKSNTAENNHRFIKQQYRFLNRSSGALFEGTPFSFRMAMGFTKSKVSELIHGKRKSHLDWTVIWN